MTQPQIEFLSLAVTPARLRSKESSWMLGFEEQDIPVLVSAGLLKPLGHPAPSGSKYFAAFEMQALRTDARWLAKASDAIVKHWRVKNSGRRAQCQRPPATALKPRNVPPGQS